MDQEPGLLFQQRIARLQGLLEATRRVHASIDLGEVLGTALRILVKELELPGALVLPGAAAPDIPSAAYGRAAEAVLPAPEACRAIRWLPLKGKEGGELARFGILERPGLPLAMDEEDFLEGLALQAAVAVENARYHEKSLQWARVSRDLETARAIQRSLLPQSMPNIKGYGVAARSEACYEVGGDYLDIFSAPGGKWVLVVADVAGKGLSSALVGSAFRAAMRAGASAGAPLAELASALGEQHFQDGEEARMKYVTAIMALLDPKEHSMEVVNAGHPPVYVVSADGSEALLKSSGLPLGLMPGITYQAQRTVLPPGGTLLAYSDGLSEAASGSEEFGLGRILETLKEARALPAEGVLETLWGAVKDFEGGGQPGDDKTALVLQRMA
jgi:serine phosphatase RsbU (regulator of sigma subunit)